MGKFGEEMAEELTVEASTAAAVQEDRDLRLVQPESLAASKPNGWRCLRQELATGLPLLVADCLAVCGSVLLATAFVDWILPGSQYQILSLARQLVAIIGLTVLVFAAFGLYPGTGINPIVEFRSCVTAVTLVFISLMLGNAIFGRLVPYESWLFVIGLLVALINVNVFRSVARSLFSRFHWWGQPVLIIGNGESAVSILKALQPHSALGLRPVGIVGDMHEYWSSETAFDEAYLGPTADLAAIADKYRAYWAILTTKDLSSDTYDTATYGIPNVVVMSELDGMPSLWNRTHDYAGKSGIHIQERLLLPVPQAIKRATELILVLLVGALALPLMGMIAALIKLESRGPIYFAQSRIGRGGSRFSMWKFRTMRRDAEAVLEQCLAADPALREEWQQSRKLRKDPRLTRIGRFLRRTSLDELPQFWNVLRGEMSLVGPRPLPDYHLLDFGEHFQRLRFRVLPGITGLWQINGRSDDIDRLEHYDTYYIRNWGPWLDLYILARTIRVVLFREGAY